MKRWVRRLEVSVALAGAAALAASPAQAWGYEGQQVIATIARAYLTPAVRAKVDAILASDTDTLTGPDMVARATWADAWRSAGHRETADWHLVGTEIARPDLQAACFAYPNPAAPASAGPAQDCVMDKVEEFSAELAAPTTPPAEKLLALKYLLHFVGDLLQPLHAADNQDRGGNCVMLSLGGSRTVNRHSWWYTSVVKELGPDAATISGTLRAAITPADKARCEKGNPKSWAMESFAVAKASAYRVGSPAGCSPNPTPVVIPGGYYTKARAAAALQLERAGVRLALLLNRALG